MSTSATEGIDTSCATIREHGFYELRKDGSIAEVYEPRRRDLRVTHVGEPDFGRTVWGIVLPLRPSFDGELERDLPVDRREGGRRS